MSKVISWPDSSDDSGLYVGGVQARDRMLASAAAAGERLDVVCVLVHPLQLPESAKRTGCSQLDVVIDDSPEEDLRRWMAPVFDFISAAEREQRSVLVHCQMGISRSVSFVCGYLIRTRRLSVVDSVELVRSCRPAACPNEGFIRQLCALETELVPDGERLDVDRTLQQIAGGAAPHASWLPAPVQLGVADYLDTLPLSLDEYVATARAADSAAPAAEPADDAWESNLGTFDDEGNDACCGTDP